MTFAAGTEVPVERSRAEIERLLTRYGASRFASGWDERGAQILFEAQGRRVRFVLTLPLADDPKFARTETGRVRHHNAVQRTRQAYEAEVRRRWRALALVIKAKLEAVESGISTFEDEFLAHIVLPTGGTVGEWAHAQLEAVYKAGRMPPMLPGASSERELGP